MICRYLNCFFDRVGENGLQTMALSDREMRRVLSQIHGAGAAGGSAEDHQRRPPVAVGDRVEAQYGADTDEAWYAGTVVAVHDGKGV